MINNKSGVILMIRMWVFCIIVKFFFFFGKYKLSYYVVKKFLIGK